MGAFLHFSSGDKFAQSCSVQYFTTSIPGAGIFLPSSKAYKRISQPISSDSFPPTPTTPSLAAFNLGGRGANPVGTPPTPSISKLSQSVGHRRAASPALKPKSRPSLPRPESPLRITQNPISTPISKPSVAAPNFSRSTITPSRNVPSPAPGKFGGSVRGLKQAPGGDPVRRPSKFETVNTKGMDTKRSPSRSQSRLGPDSRFDEEPEEPVVSTVRSKRTSLGHKPRRSNEDADEIRNLKNQLAERDKQLKDQALSLAEMENNVSELHSTLTIQQPPQRPRVGSRHPSVDDADIATLRDIVREKNEKIAVLTAEFDGHRADFRSTIDTLELASTETERVYERRVEELTQEIRELQDRSEDVESVAQQLKQLEELVQELEEGLEDARRGESEARGEVEFLRGEVERGRSELRREKEIAASALEEAKANEGSSLNSQRMSRDLEQRDDEIRGLKAIIHSLSRDGGGPDAGSPKLGSRRVSRQRQSGLGGQSNGFNEEQLMKEREARQNLERHVKELENMVDAKTHREDELERQLKLLTHDLTPSSPMNGHNISSQNLNARPGTSGGTRNSNSKPLSSYKSTPTHQHRHTDSGSTVDTSGSNSAWCEICEQPGHDILTCTKMFTKQQQQQQSQNNNSFAANNFPSSPNSQRTGRDVVKEGLKGLAVSSPHHNHNDHNDSIERPSPLNPAPRDPAPAPAPAPQQQQQPSPAMAAPATAQAPGPNEEGMVAGKRSGKIDTEKWCALCERDGHESVDCPFEDEF